MAQAHYSATTLAQAQYPTNLYLKED